MDERTMLAGVSIAAEPDYRYAVTLRGGRHDDDSVRLVLHASYGVTHRYTDPQSRREVPAIAYLAAAFV